MHDCASGVYENRAASSPPQAAGLPPPNSYDKVDVGPVATPFRYVRLQGITVHKWSLPIHVCGVERNVISHHCYGLNEREALFAPFRKYS